MPKEGILPAIASPAPTYREAGGWIAFGFF